MCTNQKHQCLSDQKFNGVLLKEKKTRIVTIITFIAMIVEITFGYLTNSMALLSDGWHMCTHVIAIGTGWVAYKYIAHKQVTGGFNSDPDRILALTGYTNALALLIMSLIMITESIHRISEPILIEYKQAFIVSLIGLLVNLVSINVLCHHDMEKDVNLKASYLHVMSDVLTSFLALVALALAYYFNWIIIDALVGLLGATVILVWSWGLIKRSWLELIEWDKRKEKNVRPV